MSDEGPRPSGPPAASDRTPASGGKEGEVDATLRPPRRKKRRRRADAEARPVAPPASPESDEGVPAFARGWPRDATLDALVAAFEAGDYARVRREAPLLAKSTEDDAVRRAARELRRRLDPDPVAVYMLAAAGALLVFLAGWYWAHPHAHEAGSAPNPPAPGAHAP